MSDAHVRRAPRPWSAEMHSRDNVLEIEDLRTYIRLRKATVQAVDGVSFSVKRGETVGVVGESGCGKTMTGMSIMRLLPNGGYIAGGSIRFDGVDLATADLDTIRSIRGNKIGMVFQDPMTSLNPTTPIGKQIGNRCVCTAGLLEPRPSNGRLKSWTWSVCPGRESAWGTIRTSCREVCVSG